MQRQMLRQVQQMQQKMQSDLASAQKELENQTVEGVAGGGSVKIVVTGGQVVKSVSIAKEAVDPEEVEMLEDLVLVALNDGLEKSRELSSNRMGRLASSLGLPKGLF